MLGIMWCGKPEWSNGCKSVSLWVSEMSPRHLRFFLTSWPQINNFKQFSRFNFDKLIKISSIKYVHALYLNKRMSTIWNEWRKFQSGIWGQNIDSRGAQCLLVTWLRGFCWKTALFPHSNGSESVYHCFRTWFLNCLRRKMHMVESTWCWNSHFTKQF